jgi:hypothetical protein
LFCALLAGLGVLAWLAATANAQTVTPASITIPSSSPICAGGSETIPVSITLPPAAINDKVDVFLLFDDTGSFAGVAPSIQALFPGVISGLESSLSGVTFGVGVGRFEDFGGAGNGFSGEFTTGRPFILNQPIVTSATAGSTGARDALISAALGRTAPGFGGDGPESDIEALAQLATGAGFDGDGNGSTLDSGPAGAVATQTTPGNSGDVPAFSSNVATTSGTLGGAGFRGGSLRLVLLATDIASVAPFPVPTIPTTITGTGGTEPSTAFNGFSRFGFISDSKTSAGNTVAGAVAPLGAGSVPGTVAALNALGIKVIGLSTGTGSTTNPGPSSDPGVFLSALARLTGAVDAGGNALVFPTSTSASVIAAAITNAITAAATAPVDIGLGTTALPAGLSFSYTPPVVNDVGPGGTASFNVTLTGNGTPINGGFDIQFKDVGSSAVLGSIPVTVSCAVADRTKPTCTVPTAVGTDSSGHKYAEATVQDTGSGIASVIVDSSVNANTVVPPFAAGTTAPLVIRSTKINQSKSSSFQLTVTDVAGNKTTCDPVLTSVIRDPGGGQPASQTYTGLLQAESKVMIVNGSPGMKKVRLVVNGKVFRQVGLTAGEVRRFDVASAMRPGSGNTITITAKGSKKGASADIVISD